MNFLAHCALSQCELGSADPQYLVGGFLGDFIKGAVPSHLPQDIQTGIRLHRRIDAFSAIQPDIKASVTRLPVSTRRLAPVFIDLVADHFLARHFESVHDEPLAAFTDRTYVTLSEHVAHFPAPALRFFHFMREHDLLGRYVGLEPVERAFRRIAERLGRVEAIAESMAALRTDYQAFESDFLLYYPALQTHANEWLTGGTLRAISAAPRNC